MVIKTPKEAYEYAYTHNTLTFPSDWYIIKNFKWNEVFVNETANDGLPMYEVYENALKIAVYLQQIRTNINAPINVHCWVRQIRHNKRVGSTAKYSAHINGLAVDFDIQGISSSQSRSLILAMKLPIRIEANTNGWVHIDQNSYVKPFKTGLFYA